MQQALEINLSGNYDIKGVDGMTLHTILVALGDAEGMYKKAGMTGLAENAAGAYKNLLSGVLVSK
jgi:hypothetical protein